MKNTLIYFRFVSRVIFLLFWATASAADDASSAEKCEHIQDASKTVSEIAGGVFLRKGNPGQVFEDSHLANIGFVVGDTCVAVIDTGGSGAEGDELHCAVRAVSTKPVCYVINTHVHPDHILGNAGFASPAIKIYGHKNLARAMSLLGNIYIERHRESANNSKTTIVPPTGVVEDQLEIDLGNRRLRLTAHPNAHTDNDLTVLDLRTATLWAGDLLFTGHIPILGGSGSIDGFIESTKLLAEEEVALVVPGHGPVSASVSRAAHIQNQYLVELREKVANWIEQGGDIGPAVETIDSSYSQLPMFDHFHKRNVSYTFTELEWE